MMKLAEQNASSWKLPPPAQARDYRRLRLARRESRTFVIREGASTAARRVREKSELESADIEQQLAEIVLATYRLLDPRRRRNLVERIQLVVSTEIQSCEEDGEMAVGHLRDSMVLPPVALPPIDRRLVPATPIAAGYSPATLTLDGPDTFKVLAVQDVMAIIRNHERSVKVKQLRTAAAMCTTLFVMAASLAVGWFSLI